MPKVKSKDTDVAEKLKPYLFHGVELRINGKQASGDCPFCGRDGKFGVEVETGLWNCFVCKEGNEKGGGNSSVFLRKLWEVSDAATSDYSELSEERRLLYPDTLLHWQVSQSLTTGKWLVPGFGSKGALNQLYQYTEVNGKMRLLPTPTHGHQLHGLNLFDPTKQTMYICEGPWDGMALWEVLRQAKLNDVGDLVATANEERSLAADANVLAVPGCNVFFETWLPLFAGKHVVLMFDNDHPRKNEATGRDVEPAGLVGMQRIAKILAAAKQPPESIRYLCWGDNGVDLTLPGGFDVRDALTGGTGEGVQPTENLLARRLARLQGLLGLVTPVPETWLDSAKTGTKVKRGVSNGNSKTKLSCKPCRDYRALQMAWRKAMMWTDGLDSALAVMLASVASTKAVGDQLWVKIIGPAACGKSTLCEAISVAKQYVVAKSTIRGFHSGYRTKGGDASEDNSLIVRLYDKTLVTKDGDTLLQSPNLGQILSEARDVYDGTSRTHYRDAISKDYEGMRLTWILCGTSSLRSIDSSELGERFLDCVIMEGIDDEMEDEVLWRVANRSERNLNLTSSNGSAATHYEPDLLEAMQLTGGYVEYLRENAADELSTIDMTPEAKRMCAKLGKFVAHMRARPSLRQEETAEREFASRLVSQLVRLAKCLAMVMNRRTVDDAVMVRVRKVALDTSRGQTMAIASHLFTAGHEGLEPQTICLYVNRSSEKTRMMLRFLKQIGVVELFQTKKRGVTGKPKWRLTPKMQKLYGIVMGIDEDG
jgi:hypothetical protein